MTLAQPTDLQRAGIFTVGLTGGIGSGKSTVAAGFAAHGVCVVDTDAVAHALTGPQGAAMPAIVAHFGPSMQTPDGALDRPRMRQLVFADQTARAALEQILHPMIRVECLAQLNQAQSPYALLAVPLLVETGAWRAACDRVLVIDCPVETQIRRVMARSGLGADEVRRIIASQASREARLTIATEVIDNGGDPAELNPRIAALHSQYLGASAKPLVGS